MLNALAIVQPKIALVVLICAIPLMVFFKPIFALFGNRATRPLTAEEEKKLAP